MLGFAFAVNRSDNIWGRAVRENVAWNPAARHFIVTGQDMRALKIDGAYIDEFLMKLRFVSD